jgi:ADP-heptose:LPS heptosyltransferase
MTAPAPKILVIKLGALGDFVMAFGAMRAIKNHHPTAHITLLTTKPFKDFAQQSGYFDEIWIDEKPKFFQPRKWLNLRHRLNDTYFTRVYDLQNNDRTSLYFRLFTPKPEWIGATKGSSHYYDDPARTAGLPLDGLRLLLENAGLTGINIDTMDWIQTDITKFNLQNPYALIVPGSAPSRPEKRWSAEKYAALCHMLVVQKIQPVLLGTKDEQDITNHIAQQCPDALNLTAQTSLFDIITLARHAKYAIGNDTGPMHMIAPTGCHALTLFCSRYSNPLRNAPSGQNAYAIEVDDFDNLTPQQVFDKLLR